MKNWLEPFAIACSAILFWIWVVPTVAAIGDCVRGYLRDKRKRRSREREKLRGITLS